VLRDSEANAEKRVLARAKLTAKHMRCDAGVFTMRQIAWSRTNYPRLGRKETMSDEIQGDGHARASELVRKANARGELSGAQYALIANAVEQDLLGAADNAKVAEERLVKLETQTRVLSDAVVAITKGAETLAPAVQAVKAEM
jgi:hypothetical protein